MKTSNPLKRDKYKISIKRPISAIPMISGGIVKDVIAGVNASCTISGTRYGIVNGVVTAFGSNVPPVEDAGLRCCPAFSQLAKMTETLTDASWGKSNLLTPTLYEVFQGQNIWNLPENTTASAYHILVQSVGFSTVLDNSVIGMSIVAKYDGRKILFAVAAKDGTYKTCRMNILTGAIESNSGGVAASIAPIGSGYYRLFFAANILTGATTPSFNIQYDNGAGNQYTGNGVSGAYIGQPTYINFGVNGIPFTPPYFPNNTNNPIAVVSEAGGASNGTSFDLEDVNLVRLKNALRGPNAQGSMTLSVSFGSDGAWIPNSTTINILSANNSNAAFVKAEKDSGGVVKFTFSDGTNSVSVNKNIAANETINLKLDWGTHSTGQKIRITVNGVASSLGSFAAGSLGPADLVMGYGLTVPMWIKKGSLKIFSRPIW